MCGQRPAGRLRARGDAGIPGGGLPRAAGAVPVPPGPAVRGCGRCVPCCPRGRHRAVLGSCGVFARCSSAEAPPCGADSAGACFSGLRSSASSEPPLKRKQVCFRNARGLRGSVHLARVFSASKKKKNKTQPQPNAEPFRPSGASCWHGQKAAAAWRWWRASGSGLRSGVVVPCAAQGRGTDLGPLAARRVEMTPAGWAGALASSSRFRQDLVKKLWEPLQRKALAELDAFYPGLLESKKKRGCSGWEHSS